MQLHDYQQAVLDSPLPNLFIVWGRQFGKTMMLIRLVERECRNRPCVFIAPKFAMMKYALSKLSIPGSYSIRDMIYIPVEGHPISFTSERSVSGMNKWRSLPDVFVAVDEANMMPYGFDQHLFYNNPLANYAITGTPHPDYEEQRLHWFRRRYNEALESPVWDTFVPSGLPPYIHQSKYEQWQREMPDSMFKTQMLGEWLPNEANT